MQQGRKYSNFIMSVAMILLGAVLLSSFLLSGMYAQFATAGNANDSARVAVYGFDVKGDSEQQEFLLTFEEIQAPGNTAVRTFSVTNKGKHGMVSEVAQKYTVYVTDIGSLPLTYRVEFGSDVVNSQRSESEENVLFEGQLPAGTEKTDNIQLSVSWPEKNSENGYWDINHAGGVASLKIRIIAEQID